MNAEQQYGVILLVSGPSGVGKSTVAKALMEEIPNIHFSVSCTTRAPRAGEVDGKSYHFITDDRYDELLQQGAFMEHAEVHGARYGTLISELDGIQKGTNILLDIDLQGMRQARQNLAMNSLYGSRLVTVFILPPSMAELERRLRGRGTETEEAIQRRLRNASKEMAAWKEYDYLLLNEDSQETAHQLASILRAAHFRSSILTESPVK